MDSKDGEFVLVTCASAARPDGGEDPAITDSATAATVEQRGRHSARLTFPGGAAPASATRGDCSEYWDVPHTGAALGILRGGISTLP
jgi:hypothetical protein